MEKFFVAGVGEILWDLLPGGKQMGGAPANFAWHACQLGAQGMVVSAVGDDETGREILDLVNKKQFVNGISVVDYPTGRVKVDLEHGIATYEIVENVAWDYIQLTQNVVKYIGKLSSVCFGSLAQRSELSAQTIRAILASVPQSCLKVFDVNLRQQFYSKEIVETSLDYADVLKLNGEELLVLKDLFGIPGDAAKSCKTLLNIFNLQMLALTEGERGSLLLTWKGQSYLSTPKVQVKDTVGAGDSFTAALVMGILKGSSLTEIHRKAVDVSAFVCTCDGAMPALPDDLRSGRNELI